MPQIDQLPVDTDLDGSELVIVQEAAGGIGSSKRTTARAIADLASPARIVQIAVTDPNGSPLTVGDGQAFFRINAAINGWKLTAIAAAVTTASTSGQPTVQIANITQAVPLLTTPLTIDQGETDSATAATPAVIDGSNNTVATADELSIDIIAAGAGTLGLIVDLTFTP